MPRRGTEFLFRSSKTFGTRLLQMSPFKLPKIVCNHRMFSIKMSDEKVIPKSEITKIQNLTSLLDKPSLATLTGLSLESLSQLLSQTPDIYTKLSFLKQIIPRQYSEMSICVWKLLSSLCTSDVIKMSHRLTGSPS